MLKAISGSTFDLWTVLDTLLQSAVRLCGADQGTVAQRKGDTFYRSVSYGFSPAYLDYVKDIPVKPGRDTGTGRALLDEGEVIRNSGRPGRSRFHLEGKGNLGNEKAKYALRGRVLAADEMSLLIDQSPGASFVKPTSKKPSKAASGRARRGGPASGNIGCD